LQYALRTIAGGNSQLAVVASTLLIAALFNLEVPRTGVPLKKLPSDPMETLKDFTRCVGHLWRDRLGQISLAVTTLFWGAGATLQFIVIEWARVALGFDRLVMLATGAALLCLILAFGPVSGAHFNPVVTLADRLEAGAGGGTRLRLRGPVPRARPLDPDRQRVVPAGARPAQRGGRQGAVGRAR
jgi:hypothetical protein